MSYPLLNLSINPSYYCNFRCTFCYLTEEQLSDKKRVKLDDLFSKIDSLQSVRKIGRVDVYGGETLLLPPSYLNELKKGLNDRNIIDLNLITNLSVMNPIVNDTDWDLSISYDFDARERSDEVFTNILTLNRPFNILVLASPQVLSISPIEFIDTFNLLSHLISVEVKPYSSNQANQHAIKYTEYERFIQSLILYEYKMQFDFINAKLIHKALTGETNAYSDNHLYITPTGELAVLEFDEYDREYFKPMNSFDEYLKWCDDEKNKVMANACKKCLYKGHCLTEHLRTVKDTTHSCCGFIKLLEWSHERMES